MWAAAMSAVEWQRTHVHDPQVDGWQVEHTLPAPPWVIGNVWLARNDAGSHARVVWQVPQLVNGLVWVVGRAWHETHVVGVPLKTPPTWQATHAVVRWAPVSGNFVFE